MTRKGEIEHLLRAGKRLGVGRNAGVLDVRWLESSTGSARVAIVVPRYGHTAVRRNTLKRRLRELARVHLLPAPCACDVLLRARREAYAATFERLRADVAEVSDALIRSARATPR